MRLATLITRWLLGAMFLYAGFVKAGAGERFTVTVASWNLLPERWVLPVRFGLPCVEILVGILLLIPRTARVGAFAAAALFAIFIAALTWAWTQGYTIDCGCFDSPGDDPPQPTNLPLAIARDAVLLAITLLLIARAPRARPR